MHSLMTWHSSSYYYYYYYHYYYYLLVFHTSDSWRSFIGDSVTTNLCKSPGLFSIFWPILEMLRFPAVLVTLNNLSSCKNWQVNVCVCVWVCYEEPKYDHLPYKMLVFYVPVKQHLSYQAWSLKISPGIWYHYVNSRSLNCSKLRGGCSVK